VLRTPLFVAHERLNARLTDFAGWEMPLFYAGTAAEHRAVREGAGIFDLCHMGRLELTGEHAVSLLEAITPSSIRRLTVGGCRYTMILNERGGIVDDIIVTRLEEHRYHLCVNAVNRETVLAVLTARATDGVTVTDRTFDTGQIAVQGPDTPEVIAELLGDGPFPKFMRTVQAEWQGHPVSVSRTGYTGEVGVELFAPTAALDSLWEFLLEKAEPCGLGARDTLRLEMGYPLYGHELTADTTPPAAGLGWVVDWKRENLPARAALLNDRREPKQVLCGIRLTKPGVPREGCPVWIDGQVRGVMASGNMGISVGGGIGMAWLPLEYSDPGTEVAVEIRDRKLAAVVEEPPFYGDGTVRRVVD